MITTNKNNLAEITRRKYPRAFEKKRPRSLTRNNDIKVNIRSSNQLPSRLSIRTLEDHDPVSDRIFKTMSPAYHKSKISESQSVRSLYKHPSSTLATYKATVVHEEILPIDQTTHLYNSVQELKSKLKDYEGIKQACIDREQQIEYLNRQLKQNQHENYNLNTIIKTYQDVCKQVIDMHDRGRIRSQSIKPSIDQMKTLNSSRKPLNISRWRPNSEKDLRLVSISKSPVKHASYSNLQQTEPKSSTLNHQSSLKLPATNEESPVIQDLWNIYERSRRILKTATNK